MAVKASAVITLATIRDIQSVTWYYLLQPSAAAAPAKPTTLIPPTITTEGYTGWSDSEPSYVLGDTRTLYLTERTVYTDGTFEYTAPSVFSSYEAAKQAFNEAQAAQNAASEAQETADQANDTLQEKTPEWDANSSSIDALIDGSQPAGTAVVAEKDADGYDLTDARKMATNFLSVDSRGLKIQNEGTGAYQIVGAHDNTLYSEDDEMIARFGAIIELFANSETAYSGDALAYITGTLFHITHAEIVKELCIGNFSFIPRSGGNMALKFMG